MSKARQTTKIKKHLGVLPCFHPKCFLLSTCSSHTTGEYHLFSLNASILCDAFSTGQAIVFSPSIKKRLGVLPCFHPRRFFNFNLLLTHNWRISLIVLKYKYIVWHFLNWTGNSILIRTYRRFGFEVPHPSRTAFDKISIPATQAESRRKGGTCLAMGRKRRRADGVCLLRVK